MYCIYVSFNSVLTGGTITRDATVLVVRQNLLMMLHTATTMAQLGGLTAVTAMDAYGILNVHRSTSGPSTQQEALVMLM